VVIDVRLLREAPEAVAAALARRGVDRAEVERVVALDALARQRMRTQEELRAQVKELSRQVRERRRTEDAGAVEALVVRSRELGEQEKAAAEAAEAAQRELREALLVLPNLPAEETPDGVGPEDNVEVRRWWPGMEDGARPPGRSAGSWASWTSSAGPGSRARCSPSTGGPAPGSSEP
jgi:seryl-tRNA synthetase